MRFETSTRGIGPAARALALGLAALVLAGCSVLGGGDAPATYDLSAPRDLGVKGGTGAQILIPEPTAVKAIDSDRIVVRPANQEIAYLAGSQWSDRLPRLVQLRIVEAFENTGRVRAVGRPGQNLSIDYQVVTDIRRFQLDVSGGARRAVAEVSVKLMNDRNGRVVATEVFTAEVPAASDAPPAAVAALDAALNMILAETVKWVFTRI